MWAKFFGGRLKIQALYLRNFTRTISFSWDVTPNFSLKKMIFITQCDSPALWQTYLSDPASITMEGILIFNKHLLFLLTVIVLFVGWLLFYRI